MLEGVESFQKCPGVSDVFSASMCKGAEATLVESGLFYSPVSIPGKVTSNGRRNEKQTGKDLEGSSDCGLTEVVY